MECQGLEDVLIREVLRTEKDLQRQYLENVNEVATSNPVPPGPTACLETEEPDLLAGYITKEDSLDVSEVCERSQVNEDIRTDRPTETCAEQEEEIQENMNKSWK